jgi:hypothetical protein
MRQAATDPQVLLKEADRLAWLRAWGAAERLYAEAGKLFISRARQNAAPETTVAAADRIPSSKLGVVPLILRFVTAGRSVAVYTESLGSRRHHGKVALLVNEHSASAAEMVAAFASEYGLATLVGSKTAGRLVAASAFKVGFGYRVALPVGAYYTWNGTNLEGRGVEPQINEPILPNALWAGEDQLAGPQRWSKAFEMGARFWRMQIG